MEQINEEISPFPLSFPLSFSSMLDPLSPLLFLPPPFFGGKGRNEEIPYSLLSTDFPKLAGEACFPFIVSKERDCFPSLPFPPPLSRLWGLLPKWKRKDKQNLFFLQFFSGRGVSIKIFLFFPGVRTDRSPFFFPPPLFNGGSSPPLPAEKREGSFFLFFFPWLVLDDFPFLFP